MNPTPNQQADREAMRAWEYLKTKISKVCRGEPVRDLDEAMVAVESFLSLGFSHAAPQGTILEPVRTPTVTADASRAGSGVSGRVISEELWKGLIETVEIVAFGSGETSDFTKELDALRNAPKATPQPISLSGVELLLTAFHDLAWKAEGFVTRNAEGWHEELNSLNEQYKNLERLTVATEGWIACEERLPEDNARVFVYTRSGARIVASFYNGHWFDEQSGERDVVHWQPLPAPPAAVKKGETE